MSSKTKRALYYRCGNSLVRNQRECQLRPSAGMSAYYTAVILSLFPRTF